MPVGARVLHLCEARGALRPLSGASARLLCCLRTQVWTKWMRGDPAHRERPPPLHSFFVCESSFFHRDKFLHLEETSEC